MVVLAASPAFGSETYPILVRSPGIFSSGGNRSEQHYRLVNPLFRLLGARRSFSREDWGRFCRLGRRVGGAIVAWWLAGAASARVVVSEIMYHPVEEPEFDAAGAPKLDLYEDVHEFIELFNSGPGEEDLGGWELSGGVSYRFPPGALVCPGQYLVVAKDPERLVSVPAYGLLRTEVLGLGDGQLGNRRDTVVLRDAGAREVDSVSYSAEFPRAIGADALGADERWTGLNPLDRQCRGRSLERVSFTHSANDPANWLASPIPGGPSPGRPNAVRRSVPRPIVSWLRLEKEKDRALSISKNEPVLVECGFSPTNGLAGASLEWFLQDIEGSNEPSQAIPMIAVGGGQSRRFRAVLPGQADRSVVRYRICADPPSSSA